MKLCVYSELVNRHFGRGVAILYGCQEELCVVKKTVWCQWCQRMDRGKAEGGMTWLESEKMAVSKRTLMEEMWLGRN